MIRLIDMYEAILNSPYDASGVTDTEKVLYDLLLEREMFESISHQEMPSLEDHCRYIQSMPYQALYLIEAPTIEGRPIEWAGGIYLSDQREIGIGIFKKYRRMGIARKAIKLLMEKHPGNFLANINPANQKSIDMFENMGFSHIQNTYILTDEDRS